MTDPAPHLCASCGYSIATRSSLACCPECGFDLRLNDDLDRMRRARSARVVRSGAVALSALASIPFVLTLAQGRAPWSPAEVLFAGGCCLAQLLPVLLALSAVLYTASQLRSGSVSQVVSAWASLGLLVGVDVPTALIFLAWLGDWGGFATGSSTSAVALFFAPFAVMAAGAAGALVGAVAGSVIQHRRTPGSA